MVAGRLHTVDSLLSPYAGKPAAAPVPVAHAHADDEYWWHEPERLHRYCCEG